MGIAGNAIVTENFRYIGMAPSSHLSNIVRVGHARGREMEIPFVRLLSLATGRLLSRLVPTQNSSVD